MKIVKLPLAVLIRSGWRVTEMRVRIHPGKVQQYADEKREGASFPLPVVFEQKGIYWIGDGFHRLLADQLNHKQQVVIELRQATKTYPVPGNIQANKAQRGWRLLQAAPTPALRGLAR